MIVPLITIVPSTITWMIVLWTNFLLILDQQGWIEMAHVFRLQKMVSSVAHNCRPFV